MEASINALVHSQAALLAKAYDTVHEQEAKTLVEAIEEEKEAILAQSVKNREVASSPERAKVRPLRRSSGNSSTLIR